MKEILTNYSIECLYDKNEGKNKIVLCIHCRSIQLKFHVKEQYSCVIIL